MVPAAPRRARSATPAASFPRVGRTTRPAGRVDDDDACRVRGGRPTPHDDGRRPESGRRPPCPPCARPPPGAGSQPPVVEDAVGTGDLHRSCGAHRHRCRAVSENTRRRRRRWPRRPERRRSRCCTLHSTASSGPTSTTSMPRRRQAHASALPAGPSPMTATSTWRRVARHAISPFEFGHAAELFDDVRGRVLRVERAVDGLDVDRDPAELAPLAEPFVEAELADRCHGRRRTHPCPLPGAAVAALVDEREVVTHRHDARGVGERAVAGHDGVDVEAEHEVARRDPVRQGPGPDDRRAADEQDVARVDRARVGHVHDRVARGVGRDRPRSARRGDHRHRGRGGRRTFVVGGTSSMPSKWNSPKNERKSSPTSPGGLVQRRQHRRRHVGHLVGGRRRGHDLDVGSTTDHLAIAVAVVAVGVGVDHRVDRRAARHRRHRVEHRRGQLEIEQRVDEQRLPVADDQPGVAPSPTAVGLQVREAAVAEFVQSVGVVGQSPCASSCHGLPRRQRAVSRSASIVVGRCVFTSGIEGNTDASQTYIDS